MRTKPAPHVKQRQLAERRQRQIDPSGGGGPEFKPAPKRVNVGGHNVPAGCPACEWTLKEFERVTALRIDFSGLNCRTCKRKQIYAWNGKEMIETK